MNQALDFANKAADFTSNPPYKTPPYSSRNWGGKRHSLCSYHGKLKPSIAHFLVSEFTQPGDVVLDPLCGVGTIPYEACRQGRFGVGNDLSKLAYCVSKAKLECTDEKQAFDELRLLEEYIDSNLEKVDHNHIPYATFGFNKTLADYFHPDTLIEIVLAREYFLSLSSISSSQAMVEASVAHILHGNRPYALSRRSHPLTPYAPSGPFEYKRLVDHAEKKLRLTFSDQMEQAFVQGRSVFGSYETLSGIDADAIITSPPFAGSMKFYMQNWMRLWFAGWDDEQFKSASRDFLDSKQSTDFSVYKGFFQVCKRNLKPGGIAILHLGKNKQFDMAELISPYYQDDFSLIHCAGESVAELEKHGIKDKGGTSEHQFLFLQAKA